MAGTPTRPTTNRNRSSVWRSRRPYARKRAIPVVQKNDGRVSADPNDPEVARAIRNEQIQQRKTKRAHSKRNRIIGIVGTILGLLGLAGAAVGTYRWSQTKYYLGDDNGSVTIFQGVPTSIFGLKLSHAVADTGMKASEWPPS